MSTDVFHHREEPPTPHRRSGVLRLRASVLGEHLHLDCEQCDCSASAIEYSIPDGFLVVECPKCRRTTRLKLWHHALWRSEGHGETAAEFRSRQAAFISNYQRTWKPGDPQPAWPMRKRRVKR